MDEFVANFNLDRQEFEADFELEQPVEFDALFEINPAGASWGSITGTLSNQTDLQNALNLKADKTELDADVELLNQTITEAYNTLDSKIDDVNSDLSGDISALTQTVENNNTAINNRVDGIVDSFDADIEEINTAIQNEATTRAENDSLLQGSINTLNTNLTNEISNRTTADSGLQTQINSVKQTADSALQPNDNITLLNNNAGYITNADLPTLEDLTTQAQLDAINSGATTSKIGQIATNTSNINSLSDTVTNNYNTLDGRITSEVSALNTAIGAETTNRQNADNALQSQIDAIVSSSDVFDIVGTYAELQAYDISTVPVNDIIKVLVDSTHNNSATYYRCTETNNVKSWTYIGAEGAYYTKSEADNKFVEQTTTVNGKALSNNITLTASDVGALPSSTVIGSGVLTIQVNGSDIDTFNANATSNKSINITVPTATSDLTNDSNFATVSQIPTNNNQLTNGAGYITSADLPTNYVTTDTDQNIIGTKTFVGSKKIAFKQSGTSDKLGFTLYNNSNVEKGYLEFNPTNTIDGAPLMTLGNYATSASGITQVGFRRYSSVSGANGAYNLLTPLIADAKSPFNLTTTYTNFYLPLGFTDGTNTIKTAKSGVVNLSTLLPDLSNYVTSSTLTTTLEDYVLSSSLATVATSGNYNDLTNKPTIPDISNLANKDLSNLSSTGNAKFQAPLVSGTNIKTINNESLLGSGNIDIQTGGTVDDSFSTTSENPLQNKVITNALMDVTTGSYYVYGSPTISNNIISNMSTSDYILTDYVWNCTSSDNWALTVWIETFDYVNNPIVFSNSVDGTKSIEVGFSQEQLYVKLSSDGNNWDIADTAVPYTNFLGGAMAFQLRYDRGYVTIFTYSGYYSQYTSYQGTPYNTNSQMKIYNSVSTNTTTIDLSKSSMVVNNSTVWDGSGGAIAYTPKFQEKLVSGTNIKTINGTSLLGSGNIDTLEIFIAEYGVTSFADIQTAYNAGKAIFCNNNNHLYVLYNFLPTNRAVFTVIDLNTSYRIECILNVGWNTVPSRTLEQTSNKVTSISSSSTNTQYPSAKCVYDELADVYDELVDKADTDLSNLSATGQKVIDGQWVGSYSQISTAKATGTYDIDLSSYLPNDNYNYEVYFFAHMYSSNSTYSKVYVKTSILSTAGETSGIRVGYVGANSRQGVTNTILPIGADRILTIEITGRTLDGSDTGFCLAGYRRLGTNS